MEVMARKLGTAAFKYFNTERISKPRLTFDSFLFRKILDAWFNGMASSSERDEAMDKFIAICRDDRVGLQALAVDLEIQRAPTRSAEPDLARMQLTETHGGDSQPTVGAEQDNFQPKQSESKIKKVFQNRSRKQYNKPD